LRRRNINPLGEDQCKPKIPDPSALHKRPPPTNPPTASLADIAGSNSLADLAARIRAEHEATGAALKRGLAHAIAAGDLLLEAKAKLKHGKWLPWLETCGISERTAQRYMRLARNRSAIEANPTPMSDLDISGALALLSVRAGSEDEVAALVGPEIIVPFTANAAQRLADFAIEFLEFEERCKRIAEINDDVPRMRALFADARAACEKAEQLLAAYPGLAVDHSGAGLYEADAASREWHEAAAAAKEYDPSLRSFPSPTALGGKVCDIANEWLRRVEKAVAQRVAAAHAEVRS
jgi:hypothetical protein